MREPTDKTIEIVCGECEAIAVGLEAMISHIIEIHPNYSLTEAREFALAWLEDAYEKWQEMQEDFAKDQQYERRMGML